MAPARKSTSSSSSSAITLPSEEELLQVCRGGDPGAATSLISSILETVIGAARSSNLEDEVETAARASEILTADALFATKQDGGDKDDSDTNDIHEIFAQSLTTAVWWQACRSETSLSGNTSFCSVMKAVLEAAAESSSTANDNLLTRLLLQTVPDTKLLQQVVPNDSSGALANMDRKLRLTNTTVFYRQHKFNLLAEESEGYSKWFYFLQYGSNSNSNNSSNLLLSNLIGTYSLDPNRCLDLTVDALEYELLLQSSNHASDQLPDWNTERLEFLAQSCLRPLSATTKLPQLLGFKLQGRTGTSSGSCETSAKSLLRCMTWLCLQADGDDEDDDGGASLLKPQDVLPYLPDEQPLAEVLDAVYKEHCKHEKARIQALGRVRLTSTSESGGDESAPTAAADLQPLQKLYAVQWIQTFLQNKAFGSIEPVFWDCWSELAVLFPDTIGTAILDWVQEKVDGWIVGSPPWVSDNRNQSASSLPSIETVLDAIDKPLEYTEESGCIALRPELFTQLCRLFAALLKEEGADTVSESFITFLRFYLVPSMSGFAPNPALSMELWKVLEQLPYRTRYNLYRSWRGNGLERAALKSDKPLWLIEGELQTGKEARYALKRLSKDTIRDMSRAIAKCANVHPLVVFTTILNQIESYDNLVQVMVDACRFVTPLSLDVLGFCILQRLSGSSGGVNRSRLKENGVNVSQWLQSLETFTGAFYKRFPFTEFQGILCYLLNRLKDGNVMELGVLRMLLKSSGGWSFADYAPAASLSATQLIGRAASTMLKRETMAFGVVDDINLRASDEVRRVLQSDSMGVSLLILLAQVRHQVVFETSGRPKPIKLIGNLVDTCQVTMAILLDFLTNATDGKDKHSVAEIRKYAAALPSLSELLGNYKVDFASTWMLCRPLIRAAASDDLYADDDEIMIDEETDILSKFKITEETRKSCKTMLPDGAWSHLSMDLFEFFFTNTLYDLFCPEDLYVSEIARLDKETERLSQKRNAPHAPQTVQPGAPSEKTDEEELERVKNVAATLSTDFVKQKSHVESVYTEMVSKAGDFFVSDQVTRDAAVVFFVRCIYPRCMQGPDDALYCAHFVTYLHKNETPGFSTLHYFDTLIITLSRALYCLTEGEAACASLLLLETWKTVSKWRYDDKSFDSELAGKPGSFMVLSTEDENAESTSVSKQEYKKLYNKWHAAIGASCIGCLQSKEYMHLRNCLVVLTRMVEVYPTRPKLANNLLRTLEPLQDESNTLADIRASAQAYSMQLQKARDDGVWKEEDAATVKARHEKEEAAAAERQKKAEKQMAEIERESANITAQIGTDSRDRSRGRGAGRPADDHHGRGGPPPDHGRGYDHGGGGDDHRRRPMAPPSAEERRNLGIRPPPPPRDPNQSSRAPPPGSDRWQRDRAPGGPYALIDASSSRGGGGHEQRNLEGRWQGPGGGGGGGGDSSRAAAGRKRSRTSSPVEQSESREEAPSSAKRSRRDDDRGGGGRRRGRR